MANTVSMRAYPADRDIIQKDLIIHFRKKNPSVDKPTTPQLINFLVRDFYGILYEQAKNKVQHR